MAYDAKNMTITTTHRLVEKSCYTCKFPFMVPEWFEKQCRENKREWFCPACRSSTLYTVSEIDRLKKQLDDQVGYWKRQYENEQSRATVAENRRRAAAGQITKLKKRVGNGVCPCCNRTFQNLLRHMATKHPELASGESDG